LNGALICKPQVELVNQSRWLQCVIRSFVPHLAASQLLELTINERKQHIPRARIAFAPLKE
jgi:hypothetical protein